MAKLFKDFKYNLTVSDFINRGGQSYIIVNNAFFTIPSGAVYNESVAVSSSHTIIENSDIIIQSAVVLTSDHLFALQNALDQLGLISLATDATVSNQNTALIEVLANLSVDHAVVVLGGSDYNNAIVLSQDVAVANQMNALINASVALSQDLTISNQNTIDAVGVVILSQDVAAGVINIAGINGAIILSSDNAIANQTAVLLNGALNLSADGVFSNANNVVMSEQLNLQTESDLSDAYLSDYLKTIAYLTDNNIEITYDLFSELLMQLVAMSQLSFEYSKEILVAVEMQLDNQLLFDLFLDAYNEIIFTSEAGIMTVADVLSIINVTFGLDLNAEIIVSAAKLFDGDIIINAAAIVSFIGEVMDYSQNEILLFPSKITTNILLKSMICNLFFEKSKITNELKTNSKIK